MEERPLTFEEAAKALGCSRRWLQAFLARRPADECGNPFYVPIGNRKKFTDDDIARIRATIREEERCRLSLSRRGARKTARSSRGTITCEEPTSESLWTKVHALCGPRLQRELDRQKKSREGHNK